MSVKQIVKTEKKVEDKTVKELVQTLLDTLPDDVTWERLHYHLGVVESVWEGLQDSKAGRSISHEEMLKRIRPWK